MSHSESAAYLEIQTADIHGLQALLVICLSDDRPVSHDIVSPMIR